MTIIGCICILISAIFYSVAPDNDGLQKASLIIVMLATILSLFLSVFATFYGNISSKSTEETLKKIEMQYKAFVEEITENEIPINEESLDPLFDEGNSSSTKK